MAKRTPQYATIEYSLKALDRIIASLLQMANMFKFDPEDCPLFGGDIIQHRRCAGILANAAAYHEWECPFCKTEFSD